MNLLSRKKILFFIVEGISDSTAISSTLETIFNSDTVIVRVTGGDITSKTGVSTSNICAKIVAEIKDEMGRGFKPKDFAGVIQLVDTDGVFIKDDKIIESDGPIFYGENIITCDNPKAIVKRNHIKSAVLNRLMTMNCVWGTIPYYVYYFSSNLDHVIHNNSNLDDSLKDKYATEFAKRYESNTSGFINFFTESEFAINNGYEKSWSFIKEGTNSLKRYTNFGLLFLNDYNNSQV